MVLLEDVVPAAIAQVVVLVHRLLEHLGGDAQLLRQFFDAVRLEHVREAGGDRGIDRLLEVVEHIFGMDVRGDVRTVLLVLLEELCVEDGVGEAAGLAGQRVAGEGGVEYRVLVHEALASRVYPEAGLAERAIDDKVVRSRHVLWQEIDHLLDDLRLVGTHAPHHLKAFAVQAGNAEREEVLAPFVSGVVLDHLGVVTGAAGRQDDRLAPSFDLFPIRPFGQHADHGVAFLDEAPHRCVEAEVHAQVLSSLGQRLDHAARKPGSEVGAAVGRSDHVPGLLGGGVAAHGLGRGIHVGGGQPLHPHVLQPVDRVAGLEVVLAHKARISSPVDEVHVLAVGLARGDADHMLLLEPGLYPQRPHAHIGRPAGGVPLLESDDAGTVLRG